jgi:hypothetical protein
VIVETKDGRNIEATDIRFVDYGLECLDEGGDKIAFVPYGNLRYVLYQESEEESEYLV